MAKGKGYMKIEVESNSAKAIKMLLNGYKEEPRQTLVNRIKDLCIGIEVRFRHIYREANVAADFMAKIGTPQHFEAQIHDAPPGLEIMKILSKDARYLTSLSSL